MVFAMQVTRTGSLAQGNPGVPGSTQASSLRYLHNDHLGSIAAISDEAGQVIERLAYDPWGKRRYAAGSTDPTDSLAGLTTERGYTLHEHLDEVGIIHMNGRVYDPLIGRFMSADPHVTHPFYLQSFNRYSYVLNNPLNLTDPSGFDWWSDFRDSILKPVVIGYIGYLTGGALSTAFASASGGATTAFGSWAVTGAGATFQASALGGVLSGAAGGFVAGALSSGTLQGGVQGALTGGMFGGVGASYAAGTTGSYVGHGVAGCISSVAGGGNCGSGAASALFGKFTTNNINIQGDLARGIATTIAGGVGSVIAGGKFENGAATAAFGYLFNAALHSQGTGSSSNKLQSLKNSFLRPFGLEDKLVIGEDMNLRVIPYADSIRADYYGGLGRKGSESEYMNDNVNFIKEKMNQGYTIIDIGPSPTKEFYPNITSPYYAAEIIHIATQNSIGGVPIPYQNYRIDTKSFEKWLGAPK